MRSAKRPSDLFDISEPLPPVTWTFLVNRLQTLYYILFFPHVLAEAAVIWLIPLAAACSHLNILMLAKWFQREEVPDGYFGTVRLFGEFPVRLFAFLGLLLVLVKSVVLTLGYVEIVHHFLFPSLSPKLFAMFLLLACLYLARLGMEQTLRFSIITFAGTIWVIAVYVPFVLPENADYYHLLPLIPDHVPSHAWQAFLTLWAAFAGPEYLLVLPKRAWGSQKLKTSMLIGNALTATEYLFFFLIAHLFYGSEYLRRLDLPVVQLIRYVQLPFAERLEMIVIPAYALSVIYVVTILLLYAAVAIFLLTGPFHRTSGGERLWPAFVLLLAAALASHHWLWSNETERDRMIEWHTWLDASTYAALPVFLFISSFLIKKRRKYRENPHPSD